jgi:hypothetical protein
MNGQVLGCSCRWNTYSVLPVSNELPLLAPRTLTGSTTEAVPRQDQNPPGSLSAPSHHATTEVSLSYAECPACHRNFALQANGAIPAHAERGYRPVNSVTAPACPGSRLFLLE